MFPVKTPHQSRPPKLTYAEMWAQDAMAMYGYAGSRRPRPK
ncbi:hypothetical protein ABLN97_00630 [Mycobacterium tuberculosis]